MTRRSLRAGDGVANHARRDTRHYTAVRRAYARDRQGAAGAGGRGAAGHVTQVQVLEDTLTQGGEQQMLHSSATLPAACPLGGNQFTFC